MNVKIAISITGYTDGSKTTLLFINEQSIKITMKQANEIIKNGKLNLRTDFATPQGAKFYKMFI